MKIEHFALNVTDPRAVADWYVRHLGFEIARAGEAPAFAHFLRDPESGVMLEIYRNPPDRIPDYAAMDPLLLHLAFATDCLEKDLAILLAAGAVTVSDQSLPDGGRIAMLRDPWGFCIQLCQRAPGFFA